MTGMFSAKVGVASPPTPVPKLGAATGKLVAAEGENIPISFSPHLPLSALFRIKPRAVIASGLMPGLPAVAFCVVVAPFVACAIP